MSVKDALDFNGFKTEDRWLWFGLRLSLLLFIVGVELVIVAAFAKVMLAV
jgi:hypothetical protein